MSLGGRIKDCLDVGVDTLPDLCDLFLEKVRSTSFLRSAIARDLEQASAVRLDDEEDEGLCLEVERRDRLAPAYTSCWSTEIARDPRVFTLVVLGGIEGALRRGAGGRKEGLEASIEASIWPSKPLGRGGGYVLRLWLWVFATALCRRLFLSEDELFLFRL